MGCDIHMVVEVQKYNRWWGALEEPDTPRYYPLFGKLSDGVRGFGGIPARGLPPDMSMQTWDLNYFRVTEDPILEREVNQETAHHWPGEIFNNGCLDYIEDPDNHSHSWLVLAEFEYILDSVSKENNNLLPEYRAILAYMNTLESAGKSTRIVIWFDN